MAKVLVVDDSRSMRQLTSFTLKNGGHDVKEAFDGADALAKATDEHYDAIMTDLNMPLMDGLDLTRGIRKLERYANTPIIMISTDASPEKHELGKSIGVTRWLVKPFQPKELLVTLNHLL